MSQDELAKKSKVVRPYITLLEGGKRSNPSYEVMKNIAKALKKSVPEVFFPGESSPKVENSNFETIVK